MQNFSFSKVHTDTGVTFSVWTVFDSHATILFSSSSSSYDTSKVGWKWQCVSRKPQDYKGEFDWEFLLEQFPHHPLDFPTDWNQKDKKFIERFEGE